jgi:hypothetical protein
MEEEEEEEEALVSFAQRERFSFVGEGGWEEREGVCLWSRRLTVFGCIFASGLVGARRQMTAAFCQAAPFLSHARTHLALLGSRLAARGSQPSLA